MAALKIATVCVLLLFVGSDLARPAVCRALSPDDQEAAAGALLRELLERELTQKLSLLAEQHGDGDGGVGEVCTPPCQNCLIICGFTCFLNASPATCFANCTVANGCFSKTLLPVA